jgi:hypothetical protein
MKSNQFMVKKASSLNSIEFPLRLEKAFEIGYKFSPG